MSFSYWALLVLALFLASSLYFHFRGHVRFKLLRQIGDYSTLLAPYNAFVCLLQSVRTRPVHDVAMFPELHLLKDNWQVIRDEARVLLDGGRVRGSERQDDIVFYSFIKRGWKRFYLKWYQGFLPSALETCPRTVEILRQLPSVHGAMFALLEPHKKLGKHRDPFAGALRYHLGLVTPNSPLCRMHVDDQVYEWHDGEDVLFDSVYIHKAYNRTEQPRLILFCDVERPLRGRMARAIGRWVIRHVVPLTVVPNAPGDRTGLANRAFAAMQPLRRWIRALKRASAPVYYTLKFGILIGLLLVLFLFWR